MNDETQEPEAPLYETTLYYRDQNTVTVYLPSPEGVRHLMDRLFTQQELAIVIDQEKTLFLSPQNLIYAQVIPPLE